jgi:uroporphyrinogen-III synthase
MANSPKRVLVTRPEPGASETARRLESLGFLPLKLPMHEIRPLPANAGAIPGKIAAVAITSANAVRRAQRALLERLSNLPCFAVGEATATTARSAGFSNVIEGGGDAETLAETVIARRPAGPVIYLCGRVRRPLFEQRLADVGVTVTPIETYDTAAIVRTAEELSDAVGTEPVDYALLYSANAAEALVAAMGQAELRESFKNTIFACISTRVADVVAVKTSGKIVVAGEPSETALLNMLRGTADEAS